MHAPLWISTQCFDCQVERLEIEGSSAIVKTRERRYFRKKPTRRLERLRALKREQYRKENLKRQFYSNM